MIILTLPRRVGIPAFLASLVQRRRERQQYRRQLRRLDELPLYLLRDIGVDHLTREERYRISGQYKR